MSDIEKGLKATSPESGSDRYGRLLAFAYTLRDGDEFLLQRELVAEGLARVSTRIAGTGKKPPARLNLAYGPNRIMRAQRREAGLP